MLFCAAGRFCVNCILRSTNAQNEVIWPFWDYLKVQLSMENMLYGSCSCFWSPPLVWWWPLVIWRRTCRHKKKKIHPKLPIGGFKAMAKLGMADTAFPVASDQWTAPSLPTPLSICTHFMAFVMQTHCWTNFNYLKRLLGKLETSVTADHFARGRNHCHWTGNTELMPKQCFKFEANKIERSLFMGVRSVKTNEARNSNKTNGCRGIWRKTQTLEIQA